MNFFVEPNEVAMDAVSDRMTQNPHFAERYEAISELREIDQQGLVPTVSEIARANGFFRVASLQGPLETLGRVLDPDFLRDKRKFYRFLKRNPQYVTYDRSKKSIDLTISDGKVVA